MNGQVFTTAVNLAASPRTIEYTSPEGRKHVETLDALGRVEQRHVPGFGTTSFSFRTDFGQPWETTFSAGGEVPRVFGRTYYAPTADPGKAGNVATVYCLQTTSPSS